MANPITVWQKSIFFCHLLKSNPVNGCETCTRGIIRRPSPGPTISAGNEAEGAATNPEKPPYPPGANSENIGLHIKGTSPIGGATTLTSALAAVPATPPTAAPATPPTTASEAAPEILATPSAKAPVIPATSPVPATVTPPVTVPAVVPAIP
ncbi:oleosin-B6-like [Andrographis paniculata]|uniref:oleosin-B6-like n=1 Tax=Andrographis paniculata TaxID=175694 RepID=UPI0021E863C9|nr:oleosin-B6-like [Andrographis paniculata]